MRAQVIRGRAAARVIDDEANVHAGRLARALPGLAQQPRLVVGGERFRFAGVNLGRLQPQRGFDHRVEDVHAGHDHQPHGAPFALCRRHDGGEQAAAPVRLRADPAWDRRVRPRRRGERSSPRRRGRPRRGCALTRCVSTCGRRTGTRKFPGAPRCAARSTSSDGSSWNSSSARPGRSGWDATDRFEDHEGGGQHRDQGECRRSEGGSAVAARPPAASDQEGRRADQADRPLASADRDVERHPVGARLGADRAVPDEGGQLEDCRDDHGDRVAARDPRRLAARQQHDGDLGDGDRVDAAPRRSEPVMQGPPSVVEEALVHQPRQHAVGAARAWIGLWPPGRRRPRPPPATGARDAATTGTAS